MKLKEIFVIYIMSVIVEGAWLTAILRRGIEPIILSVGAALYAL